MPPTITVASTDEEILATRAVMRQLRPAIAEADYLPAVRRMMQTNGYHLAALIDGGAVRAVAGYRIDRVVGTSATAAAVVSAANRVNRENRDDIDRVEAKTTAVLPANVSNTAR